MSRFDGLRNCCAIAELSSNTIILIKFRMIRSRQFGIRSRGAGRRVIADARRGIMFSNQIEC